MAKKEILAFANIKVAKFRHEDASSARPYAVLFSFALVVLAAHIPSLSIASVTATGAAESGQAFCKSPVLPVEGDPPPFKVRLGISRKTIAPGGTPRIRVENVGAESVAYGYPYHLARLKQGVWIKQPTGPFFGARLFVHAASAGICQEIRIARDAVVGTYRVTKKISPARGAERGSPAIVKAIFQVRRQ